MTIPSQMAQYAAPPGGKSSNEESVARKATFETTSRLLAAVVNEDLARAMVVVDASRFNPRLSLQIRSHHDEGQNWNVSIFVGLRANVTFHPLKMTLAEPLDPEDLLPPVATLPVTIKNGAAAMHKVEKQDDPGLLFDTMFPWFRSDNEGARKQIIKELKNSARNQGEWFKLASTSSLGYRSLDLRSPLIDWERAIIRGHPSHPMHRTCLAEPPLKSLATSDLSNVLSPNILFVSVQRKDLIEIGPFESTLKPLLDEMEVDVARIPPDRIIIPCLSHQLPSIQLQLDCKATVLPSNCLNAKSQASIRTVSLSLPTTYQYHLKFALACNITSALRTITPWTACVGPELSLLLPQVLPPRMWVLEEVAAVTGSQPNFDMAKHLSVLIRENPEIRAFKQGQSIIVAAALAEKGVDGGVCHAERIFELTDLERKKAWLREYVSQLLECTLMPVLRYGVCLEAHGQNILARFDKGTKQLMGFAIRDFGGLKLHMPTLRQHGYDVKSSPPGSLITVENLNEVWDLAHHTIFNTHLNHLIRALHIHRSGGWAIVRGELSKLLIGEGDIKAKELHEFLMRERVPVKCFMRMKMQGLYRDYIHHDAANVLLS